MALIMNVWAVNVGRAAECYMYARITWTGCWSLDVARGVRLGGERERETSE